MRSLHRQAVDAFLARAIPTTPGLRGLHIGSGAGERGAYRPPASQTWISADIAHGPLRADIRRLPFRRDSFDVIRATEMIYFVSELTQAISECRRVLRAGGRLVITAPLLFPQIAEGDVMRLTAAGWRHELPFQSIEITPLGNWISHLVKTLEDGWRGFAVLRPLARLNVGPAYPSALGVVAL